MLKRIVPCCLILYTLFSYYAYSTTNGAKIESYLSDLKDFSGAIGIIKNGNVIFKKAYGYAHREFQIPNNVTTPFPIASNSKSFTAVAILLLQEKGLLHVTDRASNYIPGIADSITIHHLLTHTSGIPNYYKHWDDMCVSNTSDDIIKHMITWELEYKPGALYAYSNSGYFLLACIVEKVSGMQWGEFLNEYIFKSLHMKRSGTVCPSNNNMLPVVPEKVSGYVKQAEEIFIAPTVQQPLTLRGNGDLYASLDDMLLWVDGLFSAKIINEKTLQLLLGNHVAMEGSSERFCGYGFFIDKKADHRIAEFSGCLVGYLSKVMHFIDENISLIILTNVEDRDQFSEVCDTVTAIVGKGILDDIALGINDRK